MAPSQAGPQRPGSAKAKSRSEDAGEPGASSGSATGRHIMVIEDEQDLQELLQHNLGREGYRVTSLESGDGALARAKSTEPDLILLDLMLPGLSGLEVCRNLKADPATAGLPIVMLTAKSEEADIVTGLELGADDYVTKPFRPRELEARIRAVLRRAETSADRDGEDEDSEIITIDQLVIDRQRYEVRVADEPLELTRTEFELLALLAGRPGRVFTRQQIIEKVHGPDTAVTDRSVDVMIVGLRRKLGSEGSRIETIRGVGYRFRD